MATSALALIQQAFSELNVFLPGESIPANDGQYAFTVLNRMLGNWGLQTLTQPVNVREVFPLIANKGGTANPYTIGPAGDFNTVRPPTLDSLTGIALQYGTSSPPVELPRALYDAADYQAIAVKDLAGVIFTGAFYEPTSPLGTITLWPIPNTAVNSLVLYRSLPLTSFVTLTASYELPLGYDDAVVSNLAVRLATPYGKTASAPLMKTAIDSLATVKRSNTSPFDLTPNPLVSGACPGLYNIQTGE